MNDTTRTWPLVLDDASRLLETLLRDNAVNYNQDRNTREWMGGYYLNNAKLRLVWAYDQMPPSMRDACDGELMESFKALKASDIGNYIPRDYWDMLHRMAEEVFGALERELKLRST